MDLDAVDMRERLCSDGELEGWIASAERPGAVDVGRALVALFVPGRRPA